MKIKSALVTQVSGSVGGLTGSHNKGGMYFRARTIPTNPQSSFQVAVRNWVSQLTSRWSNDLTAAQREAWANYAEAVEIVDALGDARTIPALAHYVRSNVPRLQCSLSIVDDGPTVLTLPTGTPPTYALDDTNDEVDVTFDNSDDWAGEVGGALAILASRAQQASINYFKGPYRFTNSIDGAAVPPTSPATLSLPFAVAVGQKVFFQARVIRADGRVSSPFRDSDVAL